VGDVGRNEREALLFEMVELGTSLLERQLIAPAPAEVPACGAQFLLAGLKDGSFLQGRLGEEAFLDGGELTDEGV
jgi:hypothetical protein